MKRDWDTIRDILFRTEELAPNKALSLQDFKQNRAHEIAYHVLLLHEAGLIHASIYASFDTGPTDFRISSLTWQGHEFLDAIRNESVWNKIKGKIAAEGMAMPLEVIKSLGVEFLKNFILP